MSEENPQQKKENPNADSSQRSLADIERELQKLAHERNNPGIGVDQERKINARFNELLKEKESLENSTGEEQSLDVESQKEHEEGIRSGSWATTIVQPSDEKPKNFDDNAGEDDQNSEKSSTDENNTEEGAKENGDAGKESDSKGETIQHDPEQISFFIDSLEELRGAHEFYKKYKEGEEVEGVMTFGDKAAHDWIKVIEKLEEDNAQDVSAETLETRKKEIESYLDRYHNDRKRVENTALLKRARKQAPKDIEDLHRKIVQLSKEEQDAFMLDPIAKLEEWRAPERGLEQSDLELAQNVLNILRLLAPNEDKEPSSELGQDLDTSDTVETAVAQQESGYDTVGTERTNIARKEPNKAGTSVRKLNVVQKKDSSETEEGRGEKAGEGSAEPEEVAEDDEVLKNTLLDDFKSKVEGIEVGLERLMASASPKHQAKIQRVLEAVRASMQEEEGKILMYMDYVEKYAEAVADMWDPYDPYILDEIFPRLLPADMFTYSVAVDPHSRYSNFEEISWGNLSDEEKEKASKYDRPRVVLRPSVGIVHNDSRPVTLIRGRYIKFSDDDKKERERWKEAQRKKQKTAAAQSARKEKEEYDQTQATQPPRTDPRTEKVSVQDIIVAGAQDEAGKVTRPSKGVEILQFEESESVMSLMEKLKAGQNYMLGLQTGIDLFEVPTKASQEVRDALADRLDVMVEDLERTLVQYEALEAQLKRVQERVEQEREEEQLRREEEARRRKDNDHGIAWL